MLSTYKTLDSVIIKASKKVIALKEFSVPWGKQAPASFRNAFYITVKRHIELMDPENYRGKGDQIRFLPEIVCNGSN